ncbi:MAG: rRNA methyltransferase [Treponema sp.]|jgi:hypothetical protein|nr:rRNA methyltransferase [Treponema sp.]
MPLIDTLPLETSHILNSVPALINKTFPMPGRFRSSLPSQIAELSGLLTNRRGDRLLSYLGRPNYLSAYLHYFLPWNLYRLCILLHSLNITLVSGDTITDLGSGPLTFISALWIARPDLRTIPLEINCIDRCAPALEAGNKFLTAICAVTGEGKNIAWKVNLLREDIDVRRPVFRKRKQAALVCAVNLFNEIYEGLAHNNAEGLKRIAANAARLMHNEASTNASILTVEPGVPQSGRFIAFLRAAFLELKRPPVSPCTHTKACPLAGGLRTEGAAPPRRTHGEKKRWCHFAFEPVDAPKEFHLLSAAAKIPKDRLVLSFLLTGTLTEHSAKVRVISDAFPLPHNRFGRYGCCAQGFVLLAGSKEHIEKMNSGNLVTPVLTTNERDAKSGALIMEIK